MPSQAASKSVCSVEIRVFDKADDLKKESAPESALFHFDVYVCLTSRRQSKKHFSKVFFRGRQIATVMIANELIYR